MDNHVHLLLSSSRCGQVSKAMRNAGQAYVQAFNARHGRSGTLWQGRFKSCLVDTDDCLLTVIRYIELNPVRAATVARPKEYRWSSVHSHLGQASDSLLTLHPLYLSLGHDPYERASAYRAWLESGISQDDLAAIRSHMAQERALGHPRFQQMVERVLNRTVACRPRGRSRKQQETSDQSVNNSKASCSQRPQGAQAAGRDLTLDVHAAR